MIENDAEFKVLKDLWSVVLDEMIAVGSANYIYNVKIMGMPLLADSAGERFKTYYVTRFDDEDKEVWTASWSYQRYDGYHHPLTCNVRGDEETFSKDMSLMRLLIQ